ncbi:MAG: mechanosensitive ion channel family protein [Myxococcota bacterium]|nr:mechanosensitive ion channel family protein [Myxococcota bacterium]
MKTISRGLLAVLAVAAFLVAGAAAGQPTAEKAAEAAAEDAGKRARKPLGPKDDFDRGVPRTSVEGFLQAVDENDWVRAAEYLDIRKLPRGFAPREGPELARQLALVFDRLIWIHTENLSIDPKGHADDDLPSYQDYVGRIETPDKDVDVLLQRVPRGDGVSIWKFSTATVVEIPELYEKYGSRKLGDQLGRFVPPGRFLGLPLWEWVGLLGVVVAAFLVTWLVGLTLSGVVRLARRPEITSLADRLRWPFRLLVFCILGRNLVEPLGPTVGLRSILETQTLVIVAIAWFAMRIGDILVERAAKRLRERGQPTAEMLGRPTRNLVRVLVVLLALVVWLDHLGVRVTTLVAGLGIGGLAVALAAQRPIEDLIGAFTIYSTQPVRVGDFCRFGASLGTVEEIGLRCTRVRTLDDTVLTVPNGDFAKLHVDNFAERRKIWYHPKFHLRYETTPDQIRCILVEVREILFAHPKVDPDPARIRFVGFGDWSLDLEVFAYVETSDYGEYLEIAEDLNLRIMDVVLAAGSRFAIPSQTTYLESGSGLDEERTSAAEARVRDWRDRRELYLPAFPARVVERLRGTLPYPPDGAPPLHEEPEPEGTRNEP